MLSDHVFTWRNLGRNLKFRNFLQKNMTQFVEKPEISEFLAEKQRKQRFLTPESGTEISSCIPFLLNFWHFVFFSTLFLLWPWAKQYYIAILFWLTCGEIPQWTIKSKFKFQWIYGSPPWLCGLGNFRNFCLHCVRTIKIQKSLFYTPILHVKVGTGNSNSRADNSVCLDHANKSMEFSF